MNETPIHRVGIGTDLHRLVPGGPVRLGGIDIPFEWNLAGHSDADVVLHAITDALLGAAGLPDIGERFPDTDPALKGADSRELLKTVLADVRQCGFTIVNVDMVIHAEKPKLSPFKEMMRHSIAALLEIPPGSVGVKAKTNEGHDAVGKSEAIACTAIVGLSLLP